MGSFNTSDSRAPFASTVTSAELGGPAPALGTSGTRNRRNAQAHDAAQFRDNWDAGSSNYPCIPTRLPAAAPAQPSRTAHVYDRPSDAGLAEMATRLPPIMDYGTVDFAQTANRGRAMAMVDEAVRDQSNAARVGTHKEWEISSLRTTGVPAMPMILRDRGVNAQRFRQDMTNFINLSKKEDRATKKALWLECALAVPTAGLSLMFGTCFEHDYKSDLVQLAQRMNDEYYDSLGVQWSFETRPYRGWYVMVDCSRNS